MDQSTYYAHTGLTSATNHVYEMIREAQPLPTIPQCVTPPTGRDVGVVREDEEEDVYDNIPGDL